MSQWIGVHGINQQYLGREQILGRWRPALIAGLEWATGGRPMPDLDLAFYGSLFRKAYDDSDDKGAADPASATGLADLDEDEIADLVSALAEIAGPGEVGDAPSKLGLWLPAPLVTSVGVLERRFPGAHRIPVLRILRQVGKYLRDPDVKAQVDQITATAAANATVLIGHSLGSVVAYEYLRQHPGHSVKLLVTIGSPLGLTMVRKRLATGDPGVDRWVNVRDPSDPVTAAGNLSRWWPQSLSRRADNGTDAHSAERYLSSKAVGTALKDFLPSVGQ